ncbi:unnamed protein product [Caenorhabditis bovis]|uniref:Purple acid phosphatase n=1 Tax=Caenorhabditis bovis TaxID=2654633 RepID=A0A8S1F822_9PELO|nr:unnamed protein product [Caenorhabditis bovis]
MLVLGLLHMLLATLSQASVLPEQVHISLSGKPDEMIITWLTLEKYYNVGSSEGVSNVFWFTQPDQYKPLRAAVFGDLSVLNGYSIEPLIAATHNNEIDIAIHIGDIAYNLHTNNGTLGDEYMKTIEPIAAYIPYMVFPGNHETKKDFIEIINRFTMPKNGVYDNNLFWSFDYGNTHFVGLNSEYYAEQLEDEANAQYKWLKNDLEKNKSRWTIVMLHRPMYCSSETEDGCNDPQDTLARDGDKHFPGLEKLLNEHHVDMILYGHKHTYERMWPIYKGTAFKSENPNHIRNPSAPVFILTGSAGCHSHSGPQDSIPQDFSITRLGNYGYSLLQIHNSTHISTQFVDTSENIGKHLDEFYLEKN